MVASILSPRSIAPVVTGCLKDLRRLWYLDDIQLLGNFKDERAAGVASLMHGNSFPLQNQTVLQLAGLMKGQGDVGAAGAVLPYEPALGDSFRKRRETVVNLSFVLPHVDRMGTRRCDWLRGVCWAVTFVEISIPIAIATFLAIWHHVTGVILMTALTLSILILAVLRFSTTPMIANQAKITEFRQDPVKGLSTLDVHVVADHWNDKQLNVMCGYTSHLHALTNIPMEVSRPRLLWWVGRTLAIVLLVQAASLAALIGEKGDTWLSLCWLTIYLSMLLPPRVLKALRPGTMYESHTEALTHCPPIRFSCRRAALIFISQLPVSIRAHVDPWAWTDVFMPDNARRRRWQNQVERLDISTLEEKDTETQDGKVFSEDSEQEYIKSKTLLKEASAAYHHPQILPLLLAYQRNVGLC
ncbi:MAG: hypothetical protein L6R41_004404 [Letrouitia leprolyta]|nr:MAG: hypothetical protein L6R41_004404 [Letrouitia leprolyta]